MEFTCGNEQQQKKFTLNNVSAVHLFRKKSKQPYLLNFLPDALQIKFIIDKTSDTPQKLEVVRIKDVAFF